MFFVFTEFFNILIIGSECRRQPYSQTQSGQNPTYINITQTLNLITWNVRGIRARPKRTAIINHLTKLKADICLLQETHLSNSESHMLQSQQFNQVFSATYNRRQRVVCILVNKRIPLIHHSTITVPEERYIIIRRTNNIILNKQKKRTGTRKTSGAKNETTSKGFPRKAI